MARTLVPVFLDLSGRSVLIVGGGPVATAKAARLAEAGARIVVVAPDITPELTAIADAVHRRPFEPGDLDGVWYVVSAAPHEVNVQVMRAAAERRVFVNAVDDPRAATAFAGSTFSRGPVTVAISTAGQAPALARVMREALERLIGPDVEDWAHRASRLREDWTRDGVPLERRRDALLASLAQLHREQRGHTRRSTRTRNAVAPGLVSIVGAGPGDPELLTRLAARRLAEADLVLYDALVPAPVLSVATRAQRICVGRRRGTALIGQDAIIRTLIRASRRGRRVVRLKGGDPFVFGRGGEEALALAGAGVPFEIVPGVSSALAAPGLASIPVTHRGLSSAVLVTTGHDPERFGALIDGVAPGTVTLVVLMGTAQRQHIAAALIDAGWLPSTPAAIIWNASQRDGSVWTGPLDALPAADAPADGAGTIVVGEVVAVREPLIAQSSQAVSEVHHA
jgi:uroporphyrin-III C-methyltransferase/precorrin-2 dehydrogenase/sirohydrochlorin ferrochelatase